VVSVKFWQVVIKAARLAELGGGAGVGSGGIFNSCSVRRWISYVINVITRKATEELFILVKCGHVAAVLNCLLVLR